MTKKSLNIKKIAGEVCLWTFGADMYNFAVLDGVAFFGFGFGVG